MNIKETAKNEAINFNRWVSRQKQSKLYKVVKKEIVPLSDEELYQQWIGHKKAVNKAYKKQCKHLQLKYYPIYRFV